MNIEQVNQVINILIKDKKLRDIVIQENDSGSWDVAFHSHRPTREEEETYEDWCDRVGPEWENILSPNTIYQLHKLGYFLIENECEGYEDEGLFTTR